MLKIDRRRGGRRRRARHRQCVEAPIDAPADDVTAIYHLAAVYDLAVKRDLAMRVNWRARGTCSISRSAAGACGALTMSARAISVVTIAAFSVRRISTSGSASTTI